MATLSTSISLSKLSGAVSEAVKATAARHKLQIPAPTEITFLPYWICGFPIPDPILKQLGGDPIGTLNTIAGDVGKGIQTAVPEAFQGGGIATGALPAPEPCIYIHGGHIICGIRISPQQIPALKE